MRIRGRAALVVAALVGTLGCGGSGTEMPAENSALVVYSGRSESLLGPLIERFRAAHPDLEVKVRYAETAELAATLMEEGESSPAHVFVSQDAAALGALANTGMFQALPQSILDRVPAAFRAADGSWVGLSGRVRAVAYNPTMISPEDLPRRLSAVGSEASHGSFGVAPTNGSFQAHVAAYGALRGQAALEALLAEMVAAEPRRYPKNSAIVTAVAAGEVAWGLVNHYYVWRELAENPEAEVAVYYMPEGEDEASTFVNVSGAGVLGEHDGAESLVAFLLSDDAQRFFAEETFEFPLVAGVEAAPGVGDVATLATPSVDFAAVATSLDATLEAIFESGLVE